MKYYENANIYWSTHPKIKGGYGFLPILPYYPKTPYENPPEWRFLRFLMMIVTVKLPMCIVIRMVSPPFGKCGQPPAVVVQRLAAEAALPVYHDSTGFARVTLIYKKKRPEPKFGSLFGAEDGTFPGALLFTHRHAMA